MRVALFQAVRQQYGFCCGYCGVSEASVGSTLTIDHFQPRSQGGSDDFTNLVYCCHACNEHKGDYWNPNDDQRLLHPLNDNLSDHYLLQEDSTLIPLTDTGRFHIARLQLNRPALVTYRARLHEGQEDREHHRAVIETLGRIEETLQDLQTILHRFHSGGE